MVSNAEMTAALAALMERTVKSRVRVYAPTRGRLEG